MKLPMCVRSCCNLHVQVEPERRRERERREAVLEGSQHLHFHAQNHLATARSISQLGKLGERGWIYLLWACKEVRESEKSERVRE